MKKTTLWRGVFVFILLGLGYLSCDGEAPPNYQPPSDVFSSPASELKPQEFSWGQETLWYYEGELLLWMKKESSEAEQKAVLEALGAKIVGQIPQLKLYQLRTQTSGVVELDALAEKTRGMAGVAEIGLHMPLWASVQSEACKREDDNHKLSGKLSCPLKELLHDETVMLLEHLKPHLTYHPTRGAVIDTGIEASTGQFDKIKLVPLDEAKGPLVDKHGHGTSVAALIGADNKDGGINGMTSRFVEEKLTLYANNKGVHWTQNPKTKSYKVGVSNFHAFTSIFLASFYAKAHVINLSLGLHDNALLSIEKEKYTWSRSVFRNQLITRMLLSECKDTLFVIAAGNSNHQIWRLNTAWLGGEALPNVITVGATASCDPLHRASFSNYGDIVDVGAPGDDVGVLHFWKDHTGKKTHNNPSGPPYSVDGTSFSAPIVSAIALLLKSLHPALTPAEIIKLIKGNAYPGPKEFEHRRVTLLMPVLALLREKYPTGAVAEALTTKAGLPKQPVDLAHELCGGSQIDIKGLGTFAFKPQEHSTEGSWLESGFIINLVAETTNSSIMYRGLPEVGKSYPLVTIERYNEAHFNEGVINFMNTPTGKADVGNSIAGTIQIERCIVVDRASSSGGQIGAVMAQLKLKGQMEIVQSDPPQKGQKDFTASLMVQLMTLAINATFQAHLEKSCEGGKQYKSSP